MNKRISIKTPSLCIALATFFYAFFYFSYSSYTKEFTPQSVAKSITQKIDVSSNKFDALVSNSPLIERLVKNIPTSNNLVTTDNFYFFIVDTALNNIVYWNSSHTDSVLFLQNLNNRFIKTQFGNFFCRQKSISTNRKNYLATALIPITIVKDIDKEESKEVFVNNNAFTKYYKPNPNGYLKIKPQNAINTLGIEIVNNKPIIPYKNNHLLLLFLALGLLLTGLHVYTKSLSKQQQFFKGFSILLISICLFRFLLYTTNFIFLKKAIPVFDSTIYASSLLHPSLGDLLLNTFLFSWIIGYTQYFPLYNLKKNNRFLAISFSGAIIFLYVFGVFEGAEIIASLIRDSQISFNVLDFYSLNRYSFLATCCMSFICVIAFRFGNLLLLVCRYFEINYLLLYLIVFTVGGAYILTKENDYNYWYLNLVFIWIVVRLIIFTKLTSKVSVQKFTLKFIIIGVVGYSLTCALFILAQLINLEEKQRFNIAQRIALETNNLENIDANSFKNLTKNITPKDNRKYSIAIYKSGNLIYKLGDDVVKKTYQFEPTYKYETNNGVSSLYYFVQPNNGIIISTQSVLSLTLLTLFNYLFLIFLLITFCFITYYILLVKSDRVLPKIQLVFQQIKTQFLALLILSGFLVFTLISIVMYNYFREQNKTKFQNKLLSSLAPIENLVAKNKDFLNDTALLSTIEPFYIYKADGSLFYKNTTIQNTLKFSQQIPYNVFYDLTVNQFDYVISHFYNNGSSTTYLYKTIRGNELNSFAFLAYPYTQAKEDLEKEISNFITALLNIIILIFLIGFLLSYLFASRITDVFITIANKMKLISLTDSNEPIIYTKNNELKVLIDEYNSMVNKLNESAIALAKSEREGAWKEMARQVAHEIKNPLTPMKLSLQYLQKAIQNNSPNVHQLANSVAQTLTQQIDQLAQIASDFSQFANIHNTKVAKLNWYEVITNVYDLFRVQNKVKITLTNHAINNFILADGIQLNRLLTNLIKNAIEALEEVENPEINIELSNTPTTILLEIRDNGNGIKEADTNKIFTPNFTTKSSGTGLGLAICNGIVENANGRIWFTNNKVGVSFFVELPVLV